MARGPEGKNGAKKSGDAEVFRISDIERELKRRRKRKAWRAALEKLPFAAKKRNLSNSESLEFEEGPGRPARWLVAAAVAVLIVFIATLVL